ncbi:MAG TPA: hypothetical protein VL088_11115 [Pedobacter sp.]|nr:hypothetical protein [Pedobacter sp.]
MQKSVGILCLLVLILSFTSCEKDSVKNIETITYGSSFGFCAGYCKTDLVVGNEKLIFSKSKNGENPDRKTCTSTITLTEFNTIRDLVELNKVAKLPRTIGCPDCADGGVEWISINTGAKDYKVVFEYGRAPKELEAIVARLRELKETFANCN